MPAYTLHLISGPIRFQASEDDSKRLAHELQMHNNEVVRLRAEVEALRAEPSGDDLSVEFKRGWDAALATTPKDAAPVNGVVWHGNGASLIKIGFEDDYCARHRGASRLYLHPPAAEVQRLRDALKPFAAIDLTTNQAVDAMDVLRARRALEGR